jgi:hypothetical protein
MWASGGPGIDSNGSVYVVTGNSPAGPTPGSARRRNCYASRPVPGADARTDSANLQEENKRELEEKKRLSYRRIRAANLVATGRSDFPYRQGRVA